jgi:hypothetical protein
MFLPSGAWLAPVLLRIAAMAATVAAVSAAAAGMAVPKNTAIAALCQYRIVIAPLPYLQISGTAMFPEQPTRTY